jgi:uncharacterized protein
MSEYLAPGVFVEEVSFRSKSIEGVGTSVCGMVGPTRFGPIRGTPEVLTSYGEFEKIFGDPRPLSLSKNGSTESVPNYTALAARAFFENGGKQLYMTRIISGGNDTDAYGSGGTAAVASAAATNLSFTARFPGSGGNLDLLVLWQDQENLIRTRSYNQFSEIANASEGLLTIKSAVSKDKFSGTVTHDDGEFPLKALTALVKKTETGFEFLTGSTLEVINGDETNKVTLALSALGTGLTKAGAEALAFEFKQVFASQPSGEKIAADTPCQLILNKSVGDLTRFFEIELGTKTILRGTLNQAGTKVSVRLDDADPDTLTDLPLAALAEFSSPIKSLVLLRNFSLQVVRRKTTENDEGIPAVGEPIFITPVLSLDSTSPSFIGTLLPRDPERKLDQLTIPIVCSIPDGTDAADIFKDLESLAQENSETWEPESPLKDPQYVITLENGTDGEFPMAIDYAGETDDQGSTGLSALEDVEDVSIVATPAAVIDKDRHQSIAVELEKHCVKMRYRFGLIDTREDMSLSEIQTFRNNFDNSRLALYAPWVVTSDPTGEKETIHVPASGFMAGIYARTDVDRGVHKAPANTPVLGALRFTQTINKFQQELLNPRGINCLRSFSGRGHQVWGGRTLSSDPEWKYVNVRRYFLYLERSIEKGTQWAVFEPNGERLWANVVTTIESFLFNEWKNGRLLGSKPAAAYFVRCDRTTITQNDLDNGRLVCEIGVAPLTPAEFVIFRIGQKTADA